jgi:redox-sensitive bicupin YhaK (pirin superfamily)
MSFFPGKDPSPGDAPACDAIERVIVPRTSDLGGFSVRRALPSAQRRMVGPFIFLDHMGPAEFRSGQGIDVRPHPHIGLATVTYLFDGQIMHRDSLGSVAAITPGAVNWMTAGRGIAHSERTAADHRVAGEPLHGLQCWVALPVAQEEGTPGFVHHGAHELPTETHEGKTIRVVAGKFLGLTSPVVPGRLLVFKPGDHITVTALTPARLAVVGGAAMDSPRHIWWNFVSSRQDRIEQAKADWKAGRFDAVPGESEFIPLPE